MSSPASTDILIAGAGLVGLALALELHTRGARVAVLDTGPALAQASLTAAGMLAAGDPHNPPTLAPLASLSIGIYPAFLQRVTALSGLHVPFQTDTTLQYGPDGSITPLAEHSLDPRQLASALYRAIGSKSLGFKSLGSTSLALQENLGQLTFSEDAAHVTAHAADGSSFQAPRLIHTSGAWAPHASLAPRKGQMLRVLLPPSLRLREVHRSQAVYIVPRTSGPQAGSALIGATVEDAGFDLTTHPADLAALRRQAAHMLPALADPRAAPQCEAWAGLRPATPDLLPLLGPLPGSTRQWIASGHFRNGVLLAPGTAHVMAESLEGKTPAVSLLAFAPSRFRTG